MALTSRAISFLSSEGRFTERGLEAGGVCSLASAVRSKNLERNLVMYKRFIVLLGMFLGSHVPAVAQTPSPQIVLEQERVAPTLTMFRAVSTPSPAASFSLDRDRRTSPVHFSLPFAVAYKRDLSLVRLPATEEFKTLLFTQSSIRLFQLWGGRLQVDAFQSSLHPENMEFGASAAGGPQYFRPPRQSYLGGPRSVDLSGLSLSFHFGRDARTVRPTQGWQCLSRIVRTVLN
jgi:hypothetical protein